MFPLKFMLSGNNSGFFNQSFFRAWVQRDFVVDCEGINIWKGQIIDDSNKYKFTYGMLRVQYLVKKKTFLLSTGFLIRFPQKFWLEIAF